MSRISRSITIAAALAAIPLAARGQESGNGFLFGAPMGSVTLSGGWALASAHSDLFSYTTDLLTLKRRDFSSPAFGADLAFRLLPRTELVVSSSFSGMTKRSEFRGFIGSDHQPIEQKTTFNRTPVTVGVKQYLTSTGRSIGKFAWIPSRLAPYVGASGGAMYYQFRQEGDFINFQTTDVFPSILASSGWTPVANAIAGVDYAIGPRFAITTEARYLWSSAELSQDFSGFQHLDLSGFMTTVGFSIRY
jgi:hypothetical protein